MHDTHGLHLSIGATKSIGEFVIPDQLGRYLTVPNHTVHDFSRVTCISNFGLLEQLVAAGIGITFAYVAIAENNPKLTQFKVENWDIHREFNYVYLKKVCAESLIDYFEQYR